MQGLTPIGGTLMTSLATWNRAIELKPDISLAYYYRGLVYYKSGDLEQAIADYGRYLELSRNGSRFHERVLKSIDEWKSDLRKPGQ